MRKAFTHTYARGLFVALTAFVVAALVAVPLASGATGNTTVSVTVPSATWLSVDPADTPLTPGSCKTGTANVTNFGTVIPGNSFVTTQDCAVVFGSSNNDAKLNISQADGIGSAMWRASTGPLDATFDAAAPAGIWNTDFTANNDIVYATAYDNQGRLLIAGRYNGAPGGDYYVARFLANGTLDTGGFSTGDGTNGIWVLNGGGGNEDIMAMTVQPDGKILLGGADTTDVNMFVGRLTSAGVLDTATFSSGDGSDGYYFGNPCGGAGEQRNVDRLIVRPNGKIVVGGSQNTQLQVAQLDSTGALDTTFGTGGCTDITSAGTGAAHQNGYKVGMALQNDGKVLISGQTDPGPGGMDFLVARLGVNGSLDNNADSDVGVYFTTDGVFDTTETFVDGNLQPAYPSAIGVQNDGKVVVMGRFDIDATAALNYAFAAARYSGTTGALDATYGVSGVRTIDVTTGADEAHDGFLMPDDTAVMGGGANYGTPASANSAIVRLTNGGAADTSFDSDGIATFDVEAAQDESIQGIVLAQDGKFAAAGNSSGIAKAFALRLDSLAMTDYGGGVTWASPALFGVCLRDLTGAGNLPTWAEASGNDCGIGDDPDWHGVATAADKVGASTTIGTTNVTANFRFGVKLPNTQAAGTYMAPINFEVISPNS